MSRRRSANDVAAPGPAFELFRTLAVSAPAEELEARLAAALAAGIDVCQTAADYDLVSLCYVRLTEAGLTDALPPEQFARLRNAHLAHVDFQSELLAAGVELAGLLRDAGIEMLAIKGLALVAHYWPEYLPRYMCDLDVLVPPESVDATLRIVDRAGFQPRPDRRPPAAWDVHAPSRVRGRVSLEVHWTLPLPRLTQPFDIPDTAALAARAAPAELLGGAVSVPSHEDCLIILAADMARDGFLLGLSRWVDLHRLATDPHFAPDWERLAGIADELGITPLLGLTLAFAGELFARPAGPPMPLEAGAVEALRILRPILWRRLAPGAFVGRSPLLRLLPGYMSQFRRADALRLLPEGSPLRGKSRKAGYSRHVAAVLGGPWAVAGQGLGHLGRTVSHRGLRRILLEDWKIARQLGRLADEARSARSTSVDPGGQDVASS